jgi:hypothetical protein
MMMVIVMMMMMMLHQDGDDDEGGRRRRIMIMAMMFMMLVGGRYGGLRALVVNGPLLAQGSGFPEGAAQEAWLKEELEQVRPGHGGGDGG